MRIAIVVGMFPKISETFIVSQITGLIDRGHEVTIIAKERAEKELQSDVVEYRLLDRTLYPEALPEAKLRRIFKFAADWLRLAVTDPRSALTSLRLSAPFDSPGLQRFYFAKLFHRREFDLIHCHFGFMGKLTADLEACGLVRCPVITSYHGVDIGLAATAEEYQVLHKNGAWFTANSQFSANRAIELGCPPERISLIPVGVHLPDFPFSERHYQSSAPLRLLTVGRLVESKGIHIALEAIAMLEQEVRYDVVGDGPEREALEQLAESLGIAAQVTFHGALLREKVICLFQEAHLFVLPSIGMSGQAVGMEGQGLVLQEAQAMGLPVIAARVCGIPEGILDGESGLLFREGDAAALADCIRQLCDAHLRWPEFGRNGRDLVERRYNIESLNDQLVDVYQLAAAAP